jgi:hypothetical protein
MALMARATLLSKMRDYNIPPPRRGKKWKPNATMKGGTKKRKLSDEQVEEIRLLGAEINFDTGGPAYTLREIAQMYGVTEANISMILDGKRRQRVPHPRIIEIEPDLDSYDRRWIKRKLQELTIENGYGDDEW